MKKNAPKILAVVLLSAIAVLMVVAGSGSLVEVFRQQVSNNDSLPSVDAIGDQDNKEDTLEPSVPDILPNSPLPETNYFPIKAEKSTNHRFEQNLELTNATLDATHSTSEGMFIIFTHCTESGAFEVERRTQSMIKIDNEGSIISCFSISNANETEYMNSNITSQGLVVVVKDSQKTYLYTISYDFKQEELLELPSFSSVTIFTLQDSYLLFGVSSENIVYKIQNNAILSSNLLKAGTIKEVYDFSSHYLIFTSGIDGYSCMKLNDQLKLISSVSVQNRSLLAVSPIIEDGLQKFIVVEHTINGVEIVKYDMSFSNSNSDRVGVGLAESAQVFINGESIFLLLHASTERLYLVDKELSFTSSNNTTFKGITKLFDCSTTEKGYLVLFTKGEVLTLTDIRNDGMIKSINLDILTTNAYLTTESDGKYSVSFETGGGISIIGIN